MELPSARVCVYGGVGVALVQNVAEKVVSFHPKYLYATEFFIGQ